MRFDWHETWLWGYEAAILNCNFTKINDNMYIHFFSAAKEMSLLNTNSVQNNSTKENIGVGVKILTEPT